MVRIAGLLVVVAGVLSGCDQPERELAVPQETESYQAPAEAPADAELDAAEAAFQAYLTWRDAVLDGAALTTPGNENWSIHDMLAIEGDGFAEEIAARAAKDQFMRIHAEPRDEIMGQIYQQNALDEWSTRQRNLLADMIAGEMVAVDEDNTAFLKAALSARDGAWWPISEVGADVSGWLWLLVQHADRDPAFQRTALSAMEPLLHDGEVSRTNYAYLWDRVAGADGRAQRYGTQGQCVGPGEWEPLPIEDADEVDARRAEMEIGWTMADYKALMNPRCRETP